MFSFSKNRFYLNDPEMLFTLRSDLSLHFWDYCDQLSVNFDSSRNLADKAKFFSYEQTY